MIFIISPYDKLLINNIAAVHERPGDTAEEVVKSAEAARRRTTSREFMQERYRIPNDRLLLLGQDK